MGRGRGIVKELDAGGCRSSCFFLRAFFSTSGGRSRTPKEGTLE